MIENVNNNNNKNDNAKSSKAEITKEVINTKSKDADLTIIGFNHLDIEAKGIKTFDGYSKLGNVLFVNASEYKEIE